VRCLSIPEDGVGSTDEPSGGICFWNESSDGLVAGIRAEVVMLGDSSGGLVTGVCAEVLFSGDVMIAQSR
jgi:hypothetical protein